MKKIALILGSLIILTILGQDVFAEENCPKHSTALELEHNIQGGIVNSICIDNDANALLLSIEASSDGQLVIEIPRMVMDVALDCTRDDRFFVLIDGFEKEEKKFSDPIKHVFTIDFSKESSKIEIIGFMVSLELTDTKKKLCIKERLQKYPPRQQLEFGVSNTDIICKEGLQLIFKSTDSSPACVKSKTAQKLIERGWASS